MSRHAEFWSNLIRYQITWGATVLGAAHQRADLGAFIGFLMLVMHFRTTKTPIQEYKLVAVTLACGIALESLMIQLGYIHYGAVPVLLGVPTWLWILWAMFGTTLSGCLGFFRGHPFYALLFGALGGPLAWLGGEALGALSLQPGISALAGLSIAWGLLMPLLSTYAARLSLVSTPREPAHEL